MKSKRTARNVRNNREYDNLSKIEYQTLEIKLCEKRIRIHCCARIQRPVKSTMETLAERRLVGTEKGN